MIETLRQRNFALIWFAGLISETGDWLLAIGLPVYVYTLTGSTLQTSGLFIAEFLPGIVLGSVAGVFVDRWDRRRTMILANLLQAVLLLPLLAVRSPAQLWIVYTVAMAESILAQFFLPAQNALLPTLVDDQHVLTANSLVAMSNNLTRLIGSPLGGLVVGFWGAGAVVLLDAASFTLAAILIAASRVSTLPRPVRKGPQPHPIKAAFREWIAGLRRVMRARVLVTLFTVTGIGALAQGIFLVLYVVFVFRVLHGGGAEVGWIRGAQAIGGLMGSLLVGAVGQRLSPSRLLILCLIGFGLADLGIWNAPAFFPGFLVPTILFIAAGIPGAGLGTAEMTLLQSSVEDHYRGRVFGTVGTVAALLQLLGMVLAGTLGDLVGVLLVLNAQATLYILAGLAALFLLGWRTVSSPN